MDVQTIDAAQWWARPRGATAEHWIGNYKRSLRSRHRDVISAVIGTINPSSVLEVGCHCGPNLMRLATDHPGIEQLTGFDVNAEAITAGANWVLSAGLGERIQLVTGQAPEATATLADGCVDVVLSCYALAYIAPPDLDAVLWEMGRLARTAVVIAEPMSDSTTAQRAALDGYTEWAHNYSAASRWIGTWRGMTLRTALVEPPVDRLGRVLVAVRGSEPGNTP